MLAHRLAGARFADAREFGFEFGERKAFEQSADALGIALRTVEVHRGRVLAKMGVRNAIELTKLIADGQN